MAGREVATTEQSRSAVIKKELDSATARFQDLLPENIPAKKFVAVVYDAMNRNPEIRRCEPRSIVNACAKAAADGLVLDGREAALVSYGRREKVGGRWETVGYDATYIPMVAGLRKRVYQSGQVSSMQTGIVYEKEIADGRFEWQEGTDGFLRHSPLLSDDLGSPIAVYSVVAMRDGTKSVEVMRWSEVMKIARRSPKNVDDQGGLKGIWKTDTLEMARKTVLRRHSKQLPVDSDTARVFQRIDDLYEAEDGEPQPGEISEPPAGKRRGAGAEKVRAARAAETPPHDPDTGEIQDAEFDPGPDPTSDDVAPIDADDRF